jgi:putative hemolysin
VLDDRLLLEERPAVPRLDEVPGCAISDSRYEARFARTADEVDAALRLRFEVFNLELGEGLAASFSTGRDEDAFDASCHHLIVTERGTGSVVGTYRMQTSAMAAAARGFYSAAEYDLARFPAAVVEDAVELGRACIARPHRNTRVLFLLWKGIAAYVMHNQKRYLIGCCSLTSQDPRDGHAVARRLARDGHIDPDYFVPVRQAYACPEDEEGGGAGLEEPTLPPLFGIYLRFGATVCGPPALDREFGTVDFLVLFDVYRMDRRTHRMFFSGSEEC